MGLFKKIFSKNKDDNQLEIEAVTESGYIGEAQQIANVVSAGLETENYSEINKQLKNQLEDIEKIMET